MSAYRPINSVTLDTQQTIIVIPVTHQGQRAICLHLTNGQEVHANKPGRHKQEEEEEEEAATMAEKQKRVEQERKRNR